MKMLLARLSDARQSDVLHFPKVESLALGYIAGYMRANSFKIGIIDEEISGLPRKHTIKLLRKADFVGFAATAKPQIHSVIETISELREQGSNAHITIGGQYATFMYRQLLEQQNIFDSVVRFEGEQSFLELAQALERGSGLEGIKGIAFRQAKKVVCNEPRGLIENLDSLPFPARDTLSEVLASGGLPVISSSRGCYNRCSYCSISQFYSAAGGNAFRLRSAANVIAELHALKEKFPHISDVWFVDDNFVMPGSSGMKRTLELCKGIKKLGIDFDIYLRARDVNEKLLKLLREGGLRNIFIGAEAGTDSTLQKIFNKNTSVSETLRAIKLCERHKIDVDPGFIMFHPWSTLDEIEQNIKFLEKAGHYTLYGIISYLTPYTFTPIGRKMLAGEMPYKKASAFRGDALNDFVPYEVQDERAELMLCLALKAFEEFRPLPELFSKLKQRIRNMRSEGLLAEAAQLDRAWHESVNCMNIQGIAFFKELLGFMKTTELSDERIKPFFEDLRMRMRLFVAAEKGKVLHNFSLIKAAKKLVCSTGAAKTANLLKSTKYYLVIWST